MLVKKEKNASNTLLEQLGNSEYGLDVIWDFGIIINFLKWIDGIEIMGKCPYTQDMNNKVFRNET